MESFSRNAGASASRQKNCNGCVQTKRRCDRRTPFCSRCTERKIPCVYNNTTRTTSEDGGTPHDLGLTPFPGLFGSPACSLFGPSPAAGSDYIQQLPTDQRQDVVTGFMPRSEADGYVSGHFDVDTFVDLMGDGISPAADQWLAPIDEELLSERPSTPADEEVMRAYSIMSPFCDHIQPWHLYDPKSPLYHVTARVKAFPTDMAKHNATPFMHRYLYRDYTPRSILSCFATSVLYANRTPANTAMVIRSLHGSVRELVDAETARIIATTPIEKLARAQALFLYQIIRLFDGDVALRVQGEKDTPLLRTWLGELCKLRENLGESATGNQQPPKEWERWIFAESVRRTIVMAYSVIFLYEMMREPERQEDPGPWAYVHRWTLGRSLWEASSSFEFRRAWNERPHFVISNYSFEYFLNHGRGEDVDDFAEVLLNVYMGVDATREFTFSRATRDMTTS